MKYEQPYFWHVNKLRHTQHNTAKGQQASACEQQWHGKIWPLAAVQAMNVANAIIIRDGRL